MFIFAGLAAQLLTAYTSPCNCRAVLYMFPILLATSLSPVTQLRTFSPKQRCQRCYLSLHPSAQRLVACAIGTFPAPWNPAAGSELRSVHAVSLSLLQLPPRMQREMLRLHQGHGSQAPTAIVQHALSAR